MKKMAFPTGKGELPRWALEWWTRRVLNVTWHTPINDNIEPMKASDKKVLCVESNHEPFDLSCSSTRRPLSSCDRR